MKSVFFIITLLAAAPAMAHDTFTCRANGNALSTMGHKPIGVKARFSYAETTDRNGYRVLEELNGTVYTAGENGEYNDDVSYHAYFKIDEVVEDDNYNPRKYKTYSRFNKINAYKTVGGEDGMWGSLVIEQDTDKPNFKAHYIFQAGDHMGGTVHFVCNRT